MDDNDPLHWLIAEALQQLGVSADPKAVANRVRRLQVGLPAEDEFSVLLTWLGQCRIVHKLDQLQRPAASRARWGVPDLLAVFDYHGHEVPVLIEVKTTPFSNNLLSWPPAYRERLMRYADMLKLPLLVAWRFGTFWTLIDVHQLTPSPIRYKTTFLDAMKNTLMTELAGDFSFSLRPGCGIHFRLRKLKETEEGFEAIIEDVYWMNAAGERSKKAPGVFPLFTCLEQESVVVEDGPFVTQSFVIPESSTSEFAHRGLATLLRFSTRQDSVHWRRALEEKLAPPYAAEGLRKAAQQALEAEFLQHGFNVRPTVMPDFLVPLHTESSGPTSSGNPSSSADPRPASS
jgi:hypothetical protein